MKELNRLNDILKRKDLFMRQCNQRGILLHDNISNNYGILLGSYSLRKCCVLNKGWFGLIGWFYGMSTLVWLFNAKLILLGNSMNTISYEPNSITAVLLLGWFWH